MRHTLLSLILSWALAGSPAMAQNPLPGPLIDVLHYSFHMTLSDDTDEIRGQAEVTVRFREETTDGLFLDLVKLDPESGSGMVVVEVIREGQPVAHEHPGDRLHLSPGSRFRAGEEATFRILYRGIPEDGLIIGVNRYGDRTFFGDNWPDRARHWLPTLDHPSDKATVEWRVTAPKHYQVVGTGRFLARRDLGDGMVLTHWASTVPVATKVMVMGAARFAIRETGQVRSVPIQAWVYPQDSLAGFHDFARAEEAVRFFEAQVGPFPYAKLANVQSKTRYGGMENASNIFYAEEAVRGDGRNEGLIVHEVAHQWFGDSVTEADWAHLWLSEGFATYFNHFFDEVRYGPWALREGMLGDRRTVIRFLQERPDLPLVPMGIEDPNQMLNENSYQKGSWVLHMLRREVGDEAFRNGIRLYYDRFRDGNARTEDLRDVMEEASGRALGWFFDQWAYRPGHPVLSVEWQYQGPQEELKLHLRQIQAGDPAFRFPLDIAVSLPDGSLEKVGTVRVTERVQTFSIPLKSRPEDVVLDPGVWLLFDEASGEFHR